LWPKLSNPEVSRRKAYVVAGGRLTFLKLGSASVDFGGVWNFFGKPRVAKSLLFRVIVLTFSHEFNACHDKSIHEHFDLLQSDAVANLNPYVAF